MRALLLAVVLCLVCPTHAAAADITQTLLARLATCDRATIAASGPRLDVLLALADGRSAREFASLFPNPFPCIGRVTTYGEGSEEVVFVGGMGTIGSVGAMLWVDRGYWRIAAVPLGYAAGTKGPTLVAAGKEYLIGIDSGGSAGTVGLTAVTISGASARTTLLYSFDAEIREAVVLDDGHLYVTGRPIGDRALMWGPHVDWPYGAQWLFERHDGAWTLAASRQAIHPNYLLTGLIGGLRARDVAVMSRFAAPTVVLQALALPPLPTGFIDLHATYDQRLSDAAIAQEEMLAWDALPSSTRVTPTDRAFTSVISTAGANGPSILIAAHFVRDAGGWSIAWLAPLPAGRDVTLSP